MLLTDNCRLKYLQYLRESKSTVLLNMFNLANLSPVIQNTLYLDFLRTYNIHVNITASNTINGTIFLCTVITPNGEKPYKVGFFAEYIIAQRCSILKANELFNHE